ncbi:MAG: hypothetical protein AB7O59_19330 [Pirellulales bacterium]
MKRRAAEGGVQMFSFLDAMICTLGALLVLLHAFARHGQIEAVRKAEAKVEQTAADPKAERETLEWQIDQLRDIRTKTEAQLADERLRLAHVEDHERRLHEKLQAAKIALAQLEKLQQSHEQGQLRSSAALEAARVRLTEAKDALDKARSRGQEAATYSVVPYQGIHGTRRRPIYVECRKDLMILQPEGVEITPQDFSGYLGPGNPLASALRGTREYFARGAAGDPQAAEPYPLMLVRPDGVATYYAARTALESWGAEFGYELIGDDWKLKFNEPDPRLAMLLRQIVADARVRSRELMVATAALHSHRPRTALRASSQGGFVSEGPVRGGSGGGPGRMGRGRSGWDSLDSDWAEGRGVASSAGRGGGSDQGDGGRGAFPGDPTGNGVGAGGDEMGVAQGGGGAPGEGMADSGPDGRAGSGSFAQRGPYGNSGDAPQGPYGTDSGPGNGSESGTAGGSGSDGHLSNAASSRRGAPYSGDSAADKAGGDAELSGLAGGSSRQGSRERAMQNKTGGATQGSEQQATEGHAASGANSPFGMSSPGAANGSAGAQSSGSPSSGASSSSAASSQLHAGSSASAHASKATCLAKTRGRDWGLPDAEVGETAVTRPILIECRPDRLVIVPEDRGQAPQVTRLGEEASENIDEFVAHVWQHMKGWGIAGRGLYWKPTLLVTVAPGAADRYAEIKGLLADSGLEVRERAPRAAGQVVRPPAAPRRQ